MEIKKFKKTGSIFIPGLEAYINENLIQRPHPIFYELEKYAEESGIPILSPMAGASLAAWVRFHKPRSILELGTGAGYSLHWILAFSQSGLKIRTYERNGRLLEEVRKFWDRSPYKNKAVVDFRNESIPEDPSQMGWNLSEYDLVFVDLDKVVYPGVFCNWKDSCQMLNKLSVRTSDTKLLGTRAILFDNALWHGRLLSPEKKSDKSILTLWEDVKNSGLFYELNPSGDGILAVYSELRLGLT